MALPAWPPLPVTLWGPPSGSAEGEFFCLAFPVVHRPVVCSGWSTALPSWAGTSWAGCHVKHGARSSQLGLVEAGSRGWLVARVSLGVRED